VLFAQYGPGFVTSLESPMHFPPIQSNLAIGCARARGESHGSGVGTASTKEGGVGWGDS
jgi:hypothetical protein